MLHKLLRTRLFCAWRGHPLSDDLVPSLIMACPCRRRAATREALAIQPQRHEGGFLL